MEKITEKQKNSLAWSSINDLRYKIKIYLKTLINKNEQRKINGINFFLDRPELSYSEILFENLIDYGSKLQNKLINKPKNISVFRY